MTMTGADMNKDGFQCCNSLRLLNDDQHRGPMLASMSVKVCYLCGLLYFHLRGEHPSEMSTSKFDVKGCCCFGFSPFRLKLNKLVVRSSDG